MANYHYVYIKLFRAANSHALSVCLTHFTTFWRWYANISSPPPKKKKKKFFFFFFFCLSEVLWCTKGSIPLLCACKIEAKFWGRKKKCWSPPSPAHQLLWDLRDFIGWQRTALTFLTPNPHPIMLACPDVHNLCHGKDFVFGAAGGLRTFLCFGYFLKMEAFRSEPFTQGILIVHTTYNYNLKCHLVFYNPIIFIKFCIINKKINSHFRHVPKLSIGIGMIDWLYCFIKL